MKKLLLTISSALIFVTGSIIPAQATPQPYENQPITSSVTIPYELSFKCKIFKAFCK